MDKRLLTAAVILLIGLTPRPARGQGRLDLSVLVTSHIELKPGELDLNQSGIHDFAFANCAFSATLEGIRPEPGARLMALTFLYNNQEYPFMDWSGEIGEFPLTRSFFSPPHDGQIRIKILLREGPPSGPPVRLTLTLSPLG